MEDVSFEVAMKMAALLETFGFGLQIQASKTRSFELISRAKVLRNTWRLAETARVGFESNWVAPMFYCCAWEFLIANREGFVVVKLHEEVDPMSDEPIKQTRLLLHTNHLTIVSFDSNLIANVQIVL